MTRKRKTQNPFADINGGNDPFAVIDGETDGFTEIEDKNNPFKKFLNTPQVAAQPEERPNDVRNPSEIYTQ